MVDIQDKVHDGDDDVYRLSEVSRVVHCPGLGTPHTKHSEGIEDVKLGLQTRLSIPVDDELFPAVSRFLSGGDLWYLGRTDSSFDQEEVDQLRRGQYEGDARGRCDGTDNLVPWSAFVGAESMGVNQPWNSGSIPSKRKSRPSKFHMSRLLQSHVILRWKKRRNTMNQHIWRTQLTGVSLSGSVVQAPRRAYATV